MKLALALLAVIVITIPLSGQGASGVTCTKTVRLESFWRDDPVLVVRVLEGDTDASLTGRNLWAGEV